MSYNRYTPRRRSFGDWLLDNLGTILGGFGVLLILFIVVMVPISAYNWVNTKHSYSACKVENKESVVKNKTNEYRVYTDNCGVFTVTDEAWLGLFNAADTYAKIKIGQTYDLQTVGWRNGFFSSFENIVKVS